MLKFFEEGPISKIGGEEMRKIDAQEIHDSGYFNDVPYDFELLEEICQELGITELPSRITTTADCRVLEKIAERYEEVRE